MFARNGFNHTRKQGLLSEASPVPAEALPNIHNEPTQDIQGGVEDEHYHLTAAELVSLQALIVAPDYILLTDATGEIILDSNLEPMYVIAQ